MSAATALAVYGVHLTDGGVDEQQTADERDRIRRSRMDAGGGAATEPGAAAPAIDGSAQRLHQVNDTIEAVRIDGEALLRCTICGYRLCGYHEDFGAAAAVRELPFSATVPGNRHCRSDYVMREYSCPGCGTAVATDVLRVGDQPLVESHFADGDPKDGQR